MVQNEVCFISGQVLQKQKMFLVLLKGVSKQISAF